MPDKKKEEELNDWTPAKFVKWYRKNKDKHNSPAPHDAKLYGQFCGLMIRGQIELGEITKEDLRETNRFWEVLRKNNFRKMPSEKDREYIYKKPVVGCFLN